MAVIDASFQIEGSLLCISEVSNMTLRGSLTSNDSSLSSLVCILCTFDKDKDQSPNNMYQYIVTIIEVVPETELPW